MVLVALVVHAGDVRAEEAPEAVSQQGRTRWTPSLMVFGGFLNRTAKGTIDSSLVCEGQMDASCPGYPPAAGFEQLRPSTRDTKTIVAPRVGGSFELMTPRLFASSAAPRVFASVDVSGVFGGKRPLAGEGAPGEFVLPPFRPNTLDIPEVAIAGQGSRTYYEADPLLISAGLGPSWSIRFRERTIRVKPSVEYLRERVEISGVLNRAIKTAPVAPPAQGFDNFRLVSLTASDELTSHGLGPGLEIEVDASRAGPFMLALVTNVEAHAYFGDRDVELYAPGEYGEWAEWTAELPRWGWGMNFGLRFRWLPE